MSSTTLSFLLKTFLFCFQLKYMGTTEPQGEDCAAEKKQWWRILVFDLRTRDKCPGWHLVTHPANICGVPHVCRASPTQSLRRSLWGSQSSRANSPCKQTVTVSVTRAVTTGPEFSRCSEQGVGVATSSPTSALLLCHSVHFIPKLFLSWPRKEMRKEGTAGSSQTIRHLICALQSQIALPPLTPRPFASYYEGSPKCPQLMLRLDVWHETLLFPFAFAFHPYY